MLCPSPSSRQRGQATPHLGLSNWAALPQAGPADTRGTTRSPAHGSPGCRQPPSTGGSGPDGAQRSAPHRAAGEAPSTRPLDPQRVTGLWPTSPQCHRSL